MNEVNSATHPELSRIKLPLPRPKLFSFIGAWPYSGLSTLDNVIQPHGESLTSGFWRYIPLPSWVKFWKTPVKMQTKETQLICFENIMN